jgi:type I restriction enzyme S subunit
MSGAVPKLRFEGFAGQWDETTLSKIASVERGKFSARPRNDPKFFGGTIPFVQTGDIARSGRKLSVYSQTLNEEGLMVSRLFPKGTIIMTIAANIGDVSIAEFPVAFPDSLVGINVGGSFDRDFLYSYLTTRKEEFFSYATQNAQANINLQVLNPLRIPFPTLPEQQKIAAFLGAVDGRLAGLRREAAALVQFKAGLMQRLFSQKLRFTQDDGSAFPDWEEKRLGDVVTWQRNNNLAREFASESSGNVQNIHYGDIHGRFSNLFRQSEAEAPFIAARAPIKDFKDDDFCCTGDIVFADASEDYADIGKAIELLEVNEKSLVAGLHTHLARPKAGKFALGFVGYMVRVESVRRQIMRAAQGISVLGVSKDNLGKVVVPYPHLEEQRKIAAALSALDAKIAATALQITQTERFKQGLLQQMFV